MLKKLFLVAISIAPLTALAQAAAPEYTLISPFGSILSGAVDISKYLQGIIIVVISIAGVLAVVMIVVCGIKMMLSGSASGKSEAKECIWNAIFGLLIAIAAWALLFTINPDLLKNNLILADLPAIVAAPEKPARTAPNPTAPGCYFQYKRLSTGDTDFLRADTCTSCDLQLVAFQKEPQYEILSKCYEVKAGVAAAPTAPGQPPPAISGVTCNDSGRNLCEGKFRQCTNPKCARFAGMASKYASGSVSAELIKAIIMEESSCGLNLVGQQLNDARTGDKKEIACGPTQIKPSTTQKYIDECGAPSGMIMTCGYLVAPENWEKAVCFTAKYLADIAASQCGSDIRNIAAGYKGGIQGACGQSANCSGSGCGGAYMRWECLYDDNAHTQCNGGEGRTGYSETRNYATEVLYCAEHPGF